MFLRDNNHLLIIIVLSFLTTKIIMGVKSFQIIYDNPTAVYMPGQTVSGRVLVVTNESVKIRSIKMKIKGEASVKWVEEETRRNDNGETHNYTEDYTAEEEYFENKFTLVGGGGETRLEEGEHVYPFSITLPQQLPSTYNGAHGKVEYEAKVTIDIPWGKDKEAKSIFQVISPLNLNDERNLAEPVKQEKEKYYCCCCCQSGPMTLVVCLPYAGFVPGQNIPLTIELDNNSNVVVEGVKVKLEKNITFKATKPSGTKKKSAELAKLNLGGVGEHGSKTWTEQMPIPNSLIVSNLKHCDIINEKYILKVESCVGGLNENTTLYINITLGNIPLTIAQDAPQFSFPNQVNPTGIYPPNPTSSFGFVEPSPVPGFAQQYPQPPMPLANPQQYLPQGGQPAYPQYQTPNEIQPPNPGLNYPSPPFGQPVYPQYQPPIEIQSPYPIENMQQPPLNPVFQNPYPPASQPINPNAPQLNN
ncbi:arrestin domain-containing protein 3-like isoform X2 [Daktulosphaira vitifoliae]|uniref:arrestin domain-containing protein 3-like isoform X2 n=1 Tax=Daktulosphaira vitifoliae TaxID=58002 RepID=UPI0021AA5AD5|nr:arrestin domain-containing protein 3-like isoform X2 [Daktulosphaira vitifoliae]